MLFITCSTCIEYISNILVVISSLWSKLSIICQACQREQTSSRCKFGLKWGRGAAASASDPQSEL
jgi:hypothetical protein